MQRTARFLLELIAAPALAQGRGGQPLQAPRMKADIAKFIAGTRSKM